MSDWISTDAHGYPRYPGVYRVKMLIVSTHPEKIEKDAYYYCVDGRRSCKFQGETPWVFVTHWKTIENKKAS